MPPLIRLAAAEDAPAIHAMYAPIVRETHVSFEYDVPTVDEMRRRMTDGMERGYPWLVYEDAGQVLAYAYASAHRPRAGYRWAAETSIYVADAARGRGVGRAAYRSLLAVLALQGFHAAYAGIALPNAASVALHRAVGFEDVGTFRQVGYKAGAWRDVCWLQLVLNRADDEPREPLSITDARRLTGWDAVLSAGLEGDASQRDGESRRST